MEVPCKECKKQGCGLYHTKCEKYLQYVAEREQLRELKRKERERRGVHINNLKASSNIARKKDKGRKTKWIGQL